MSKFKLSRRNFLIGAAIVGGGLALRYNAEDNTVQIFEPPQDDENFKTSDTWIHIAEDNSVTIKAPNSEMGQGIHTGSAMIVAEELDADWQQIKIQQAPLSSEFNNPRWNSQATGASTSTKEFWMPLRIIGASARAMLVTAAADKWNIPVSHIKTDQGFLIGSNNQRISYGEITKQASLLSVPNKVPLKNKRNFKIIGKKVIRLDADIKTNGSAIFGIDVIRPDMLIAAIEHAPVFNSEFKSGDKASAMAITGVHSVIPIKHGVAVLAKDYWTAKKGLEALKPVFNNIQVSLTDSEEIFDTISSTLDKQNITPLDTNATTLNLEYQVPFLAHATMEPMNCTAHVQNSRCDIWAPTQSQSGAAEAAEKVTSLNRDQIFVNTTYLGGGFGRRGASDFVEQAVTLSKASKKPVKVIWSREQDIQHDLYRPAIISRFKIKLDKQGAPIAWNNQIAGPSITKRNDRITKEGAKQPPYVKKNVEVNFHLVNLPVPVGFWRSVGHSYNAFFVESAIDEAAAKNNTDPYEYRRNLLTKHSRLGAVLDLVAKKANWGKSNYKQGIAVHESFGSFVAQVVELSVDKNKKVTLHRIVCAIDCGLLINPDAVEAQMQGGIIYGLTAALFGEITINQGRVEQNNFNDYPMLHINQCPTIEVHLVDSEKAPTGVGEPGTPPIAPALTNAIFAATGERVRRLPLEKAGYSF